jgi:hypothetical protein
VLDGQWNFAMAEAIAGKLEVDGFLPEAIVVGIAWGDKDADPVFGWGCGLSVVVSGVLAGGIVDEIQKKNYRRR